jgi:aminopeptidase
VKSPTRADLDRTLTIYGDLAVKVGLNLQPGQRLLVIGPIANGGTSLDAAPLVRQIAASAYKAGARLVEVLWGDEALMLTRFRHAGRESFNECSAWMPAALAAHADSGGAVISVYANDPDLLKGEPPEVVGVLQQAVARSVRPFREHISRNHTNWSVVAAPSAAWAARVFPNLPADQQVATLWDAIVRLCRLDGDDPIDAWRRHIVSLAARRDYLNDKRYSTLTYRGPGTDLSIGLPERHVWVSARSVSRQGIEFTANIPTEEVFTMPHKDRVSGTVRGSKPVSHGGMLIEGFSMTFSEGRIVDVRADRGESVLRQLIDTDAGAARLGEIALVPDHSPISQSGLLFYNTLFDENAASHLALGAAYKFTLEGGEEMSPDDFGLAGGNQSATHVDFMIGSAALDIDGVRPDGTVEPVMRAGDWAFDVR